MATLVSLTTIPFVILGVSMTTPGVQLDSLQWGSSARQMESRLPGAVSPVRISEAHDIANGFGTPQQQFRAKVFGFPGTAYALYSRKSKQLVSIYWAPTDPTACNSLAKSLRTALGKPTEVDKAFSTTSWESKASDLEVSFVARSASCNLLLIPVDPYAFE